MKSTHTLDVIVHAISLASAPSRSHELRAVDGALSALRRRRAIDVHLGPSLVRQHSLCDSPRESGRYLIRVRREDAGRSGSRALHRTIALGRRLRISPPRNHFPLVTAQRPLLVAGGIDITPLLSMAEALAARGATFVLHHHTSSTAESPLLERLHLSAFAERTTVHHSDQGDTIRTGLPTELLTPAPDTAVYICGPDGFMTPVLAGEPDHRDEIQTPRRARRRQPDHHLLLPRRAPELLLGL
ncbi:ferredoxin reductase [Streptomyces turgidiscabies]|uniref:Ferredoxin-NADP reductase n=1 Tax=Streptomyces turgidiscabies TaxID=85558 RepID=A0ABU0RUF2_9ACTN|nr:ferredoxin reductase [Streptomyces turgidiscabies]MDQ0935619.1 ferredoxin-NADP reductase [Streptomyces turgidiscabies]